MPNINHLTVENYRGIASLDTKLAYPVSSDCLAQKAVFPILGSGAMLECCALILASLGFSEKSIRQGFARDDVDVPELLVKAGAPFARISAEIEVGDDVLRPSLTLRRDGRVEAVGCLSPYVVDTHGDLAAVVEAISTDVASPVLGNTFLLFHAGRKIMRGALPLGSLVAPSSGRSRMSAFKWSVLFTQMAQHKVLELPAQKNNEESLAKINSLLREYAGVELAKPRLTSDSTVVLRVKPVGGSDDAAFPFDGLGTAQREIVSTLFLIWEQTLNKPSVVLIEEPELHLDTKMLRGYVGALTALAPHNQYIFATRTSNAKMVG